MHFSCNATLKTADGKSLEWVVFLRAATYAEAVGFAEKAISDRWGQGAQIVELFVSPDKNSWEKQAAGADEASGLYASREPVEIGVGQSGFQQFLGRLMGRRG